MIDRNIALGINILICKSQQKLSICPKHTQRLQIKNKPLRNCARVLFQDSIDNIFIVNFFFDCVNGVHKFMFICCLFLHNKSFCDISKIFSLVLFFLSVPILPLKIHTLKVKCMPVCHRFQFSIRNLQQVVDTNKNSTNNVCYVFCNRIISFNRIFVLLKVS